MQISKLPKEGKVCDLIVFVTKQTNAGKRFGRTSIKTFDSREYLETKSLEDRRKFENTFKL